MNKRISYLLLLSAIIALSMSFNGRAQKSNHTLDKIIEQVSADKGLRVSFELSFTHDTEPIRGDYYAYGQNFYYDSPQMKAWYNAKNLWVYIDQNDEVNLSTPMKEDLTEINPLLNLDTIKKQKFEIKEERKNGEYTLKATPAKSYKGTIEQVVIKSDEAYHPVSIKITEKSESGRDELNVKILSLKRGAFPEMKDKGFFTFSGNKLPGKLVIDLR